MMIATVSRTTISTHIIISEMLIESISSPLGVEASDSTEGIELSSIDSGGRSEASELSGGSELSSIGRSRLTISVYVAVSPFSAVQKRVMMLLP